MSCRDSLSLANRVLVICALTLLQVLMSGCEPGPSPEPTPHPDTWPTWTFMVFLNGDNNLEKAAVDDFLEMAQVGSNDRLNIVVQMDRTPQDDSMDGYTDSYGDWDNTKLFVIQAGDIPTKTVGIDLPEQNMGDPNVLEDFIVWAVTNYPADHYMLVIWNHGGGWRFQQQKIAQLEATRRAEGSLPLPGFKEVSSDETAGRDVLYLQEVGEALEQAENRTGQRLDIVGFDACLMGMIEVAYEIKDNADFMVGSEDLEPGDGWSYDTILNDLATTYEARTPRNLAKIIVQRYGEFYGPHGRETQAAYDLNQIDRVTNAISYFVRTHSDLPEDDKEWPEIGDARPEIEEFHDGCVPYIPQRCWGVDLGDFAKEVGTRVENDDVQEGLLGLQLLVGTEFVIANYHGDVHPEAYGVAFYFPPDRGTFVKDDQHHGYEDSNTNYPVAFVRDFQWDNWLQAQYYVQFP